MKLPIYLDNHATTPVDPRVLQAMMPAYTTAFGNAASRTHSFGWEAQKMVEKGRQQIAQFIGATPEEIIFTSGTTESDNMALKGVAENYRERGRHIITQVTEHKAVLDSCKYLEAQGYRVTYLPVDHAGRISLHDLQKAICDETILISIMFANNEIGTIQPIAEIGQIAKDHNIIFHCDAAQATGKTKIDVAELGVDILGFSAHKMYGPKGVGALYVRRRSPQVRIAALIHGGGHERGMRSGTMNVPLIAGFGECCELAGRELEKEIKHCRNLRDRLELGLKANLKNIMVHGHPDHKLPNNLNVSFPYVDGADLMTAITEEIAVSSGSACTSASMEPSFVLRACGVEEAEAFTSIRFGVGRFNTEEEIDYTIERVAEIVESMREVSPLYQAYIRDK